MTIDMCLPKAIIQSSGTSEVGGRKRIPPREWFPARDTLNEILKRGGVQRPPRDKDMEALVLLLRCLVSLPFLIIYHRPIHRQDISKLMSSLQCQASHGVSRSRSVPLRLLTATAPITALILGLLM